MAVVSVVAADQMAVVSVAAKVIHVDFTLAGLVLRGPAFLLLIIK